MGFRLFASEAPELLKPGMYIGMIGDWGDKFVKEMPKRITDEYPGLKNAVSGWYRITWTEQKIRDYYHGIMPRSPSPDEPVTIDPDADCDLHPRYYSSLYQTRIGISPDLLCYIRWPTNEYRMPLEEPGRYPIPTDADQRYIGFIDWLQSPISDRPEDMRFEWWFVRDWMPEFRVYVNSITDYVKLIMRFLVNHISVEEVNPANQKGQELILKLLKREIPYYPVFHYSEYVKHGAGLVETPY